MLVGLLADRGPRDAPIGVSSALRFPLYAGHARADAALAVRAHRAREPGPAANRAARAHLGAAAVDVRLSRFRMPSSQGLGAAATEQLKYVTAVGSSGVPLRWTGSFGYATSICGQ